MTFQALLHNFVALMVAAVVCWGIALWLYERKGRRVTVLVMAFVAAGAVLFGITTRI